MMLRLLYFTACRAVTRRLSNPMAHPSNSFPGSFNGLKLNCTVPAKPVFCVCLPNFSLLPSCLYNWCFILQRFCSLISAFADCNPVHSITCSACLHNFPPAQDFGWSKDVIPLVSSHVLQVGDIFNFNPYLIHSLEVWMGSINIVSLPFLRLPAVPFLFVSNNSILALMLVADLRSSIEDSVRRCGANRFVDHFRESWRDTWNGPEPNNKPITWE